MRGKKIALIGLILGAIDVGVPYLFLKDTPHFWASYLYWTLLTLAVIIAGVIYVKDWRDKK